MKTLSVTDDRVRKAAESCPDAKRVLMELFPDVFVPKGSQYVVPATGTATQIVLSLDGKQTPYAIQQRAGGNYNAKGFFLPKTTGIAPYPKIQWKIVTDNQGEFVLLGEVNP